MPSRMRSFPQSAVIVFDTVLEASQRLGYQVSMVDRSGTRMFVSVPRRGNRSSGRLSVAVTDSGFEASNLHVSWAARRGLWPGSSRSPAGSSGRLLRLTNRILPKRPTSDSP
jgi:hypothetical protein